jgi:hypothetical protein
MLMAFAGHLETQKPQPVQRSSRTSTLLTPPSAGRNLKASCGHDASHPLQTTPRLSKQEDETVARHAHGPVPATIAPREQAWPHSPQNVQPLFEKLKTGFPQTSMMIPCGHAWTQSLQPSHCEKNASPGKDPGGRIACFWPPIRRKKSRLSITLLLS